MATAVGLSGGLNQVAKRGRVWLYCFLAPARRRESARRSGGLRQAGHALVAWDMRRRLSALRRFGGVSSAHLGIGPILNLDTPGMAIWSGVGLAALS